MVRTLSLNGPWLIRADHGNVGLAERWFHAPDEFLNRELCKVIEVPRAWQHVLGEEYHYLAWYRRRIEIPAEWKHARTRLRFEAIATETDAWVNGVHVGHHIGDYIPFEFDVTAHAMAGETIDVVLRVDEVLGHITKGFHDMLSSHHGGIWDDVSLGGSGAVYARPNGIAIRADAHTGAIVVAAELAESSERVGVMHVQVSAPDGSVIAHEQQRFDQPDGATVTLRVSNPALWHPDDPCLYTARVEVRDRSGVADAHEVRFGFRSLELRGEQVILNDSPMHVRGILHWGHEPRHLAPAPSPAQVRDEFAQLKELGFNCVCLCMWYPPKYYFDIADELGMLIWQEHPVWHSPMDSRYLSEYRRLYTEFLRRDRNHPSVIIVSATCEHPCFDKELAAWWWKTAREMLQVKLLQVQTSSFAWSDPDQTDLYDEHTYDNNNRWITYLEDLQVKLKELPPKPFIMGESVLFTSWPPFEAIELAGDSQSVRWSRSNYHEPGKEFERDLVSRYGVDVLVRFKRQADRHHILGRKFQIEMFRRYPNHAGLVTNHLRDVPGCTCGFMDALGRWRFTPEQTRGWMCDAPLLLQTPDERRSFKAGEAVEGFMLLANFSPQQLAGTGAIAVAAGGETRRFELRMTAQPGEVASSPIRLELPHALNPMRARATATLAGTNANTWDLWVFPRESSLPDGVYRMEGLPFAPDDAAPDPLERGYSRGFGLPVRTWVNELPDPARLLPDAKPTPVDSPFPQDAQVIVTHRLTRSLIEDLSRGGRVIHFASKAAGGLGTKYEWLFGQCPLVLEEGPLRQGDSDWIVDLLSFDLTRRYARIIPIDGLGWRDRVQPLVRLVYTHDASDQLRMLDMLIAARVGTGILLVSSLDHSFPAGQYLLRRMTEFMSSRDAQVAGEITVEELLRHALDR